MRKNLHFLDKLPENEHSSFRERLCFRLGKMRYALSDALDEWEDPTLPGTRMQIIQRNFVFAGIMSGVVIFILLLLLVAPPIT